MKRWSGLGKSIIIAGLNREYDFHLLRCHSMWFSNDGKLILNFEYRFITRNKQLRLGVDAYQVEGDHLEQVYLTEYNLNVSHRTNFEDVDKYKI